MVHWLHGSQTLSILINKYVLFVPYGVSIETAHYAMIGLRCSRSPIYCTQSPLDCGKDGEGTYAHRAYQLGRFLHICAQKGHSAAAPNVVRGRRAQQHVNCIETIYCPVLPTLTVRVVR